jgi:hypothetical protein
LYRINIDLEQRLALLVPKCPIDKVILWMLAGAHA